MRLLRSFSAGALCALIALTISAGASSAQALPGAVSTAVGGVTPPQTVHSSAPAPAAPAPPAPPAPPRNAAPAAPAPNPAPNRAAAPAAAVPGPSTVQQAVSTVTANLTPVPQNGNCGQGPGSKCSAPSSAGIDVSPYTNLSDGQSVTVTGHGFTANAVIGVEMCGAVVNSNNDCDGSTGDSSHRTDGSGNFTVTYTVHQNISTSNGNITCNSSGNCSIGASNFTSANAQPAANEDVGFG
ncbi:MAG: hypothetical protein JOZ39_04030, partial [Chloroflexi bacterium]|nr:hypothetical protein [Chloroflexota bacterium]